MQIFCMSLLLDHDMNCQCSLYTGNRVISFFNQIWEPIPETLKPIEKTHFNILLLEPLLAPKSVQVRVLQKSRTDRIFIEEKIIIRNWLRWLWMLGIQRSACLSISRRSKKASGEIQSMSKSLRTRGCDGLNPSQRAGEDECHSSAVRQKRWNLPSPTFCSIQAFNWLNAAHPHQGRQSALLSSPIDF